MATRARTKTKPTRGKKHVAPARPTSPAAAPRRTPSQERGQRRVEAILEAAEALFAEVGYDAATTEAIAERAGASIGSLYQFFPNKRAVFDGVAARYFARVERRFGELLAERPARLAWPELVDRMVDGFWTFEKDDPGFTAVWLQGTLSPELFQATFRVHDLFAERVTALLDELEVPIPAARRGLVARMMVETVASMLFLARRTGGPDEPAQIVAETKRLVLAYLASYVGAETSAAAPSRRGTAPLR